MEIKKALLIFFILVLFIDIYAGEESSPPKDECFYIPPFTNMVISKKANDENWTFYHYSTEYLKMLKEMKLLPFTCNEDFRFRIILMPELSNGIMFSNTSIEVFEANDSFYIRTSVPFFAFDKKYENRVWDKMESSFFIMKLFPKDEIIEKIKKSEIFKKKWVYRYFDKEERKKRQQIGKHFWGFFFEGAFNNQYHSGFSQFLFSDGITHKNGTDSAVVSFAREIFSFVYDKLANGEARYFEFDKKWEDLKPFEGCKDKEDNKQQEMKSENVSN